jgi:hypothetical protein
MIKLLKEMGNVCHNRQLAQNIKQFHQECITKYSKVGNKTKTKYHLIQVTYWAEKIVDMDLHIDWLHSQLKGVINEN